MISMGLAIYAAYAYNDQVAALLTLNDKARNFAKWLRGSVVGTPVQASTPTSS